MWPDIIRKSKEGGLDTIETYVFWNAHEPLRRQYDFSGNLDLIRFLKTIQDQGLRAILRIGPYVCAEWTYGGIPMWVHNLPGVQIRTKNDVFMNEMQNFTSLIVDMVKKEKLFASQGGPIILAQLETCNGWYCDNFTPQNPNTPKMWTENWTGWFKSWGGPNPHRTAEDVAFAVARFFQNGGTLQNYYMVYAQTNLMVNKDNKAEDEPSSLKWVWRPENIDSTVVQGKGDFSVNSIVDQKAMANDQSDYLWLMTSVNLGKDDLFLKEKVTLRVPDNGHILHVYVNGEYLGSQWAGYPSNNDKFDQRFVFETNVKLNEGKNLITLLSATVGFKNYGGKYDLIEAGVLAPVELVAHKGENTTVKDLSNQKWSYKIGLEGVENKIYDTECPSNVKWSSDNLPTNRNMTWYKTTFKAPLGDKPVVVDLLGLGKGHAWVNNHSLGRYWPSYIANETLCQTEACDYRGTYSDSKCRSGCGQPTQRRYHVPRSFLKDGENTLVLFEEFGGDPSRVKFETVEVGSACVNAHAGKTVELSCYDRPISRIAFASFGNPQGECGSFAKGECESSADVAKIIEKECVGKESCKFEVSERKFGKAYCNVKKLAVEAVSAALVLLSSCLAIKVEYDAHAIIIDGQRKIMNAGSIHYPRSTVQMWPDLIQKAKDGGIDAIETYIFWDRHEPRRREYDFSGNLDFIKFFQLVQEAGLYGILRIGPYVCAEWSYGGFPMWLHNTPGVQLRTDNEIYKKEMQEFTSKIVNMAKGANLFASQGGPIIFAQIENEYGNVMKGYGEAGKRYVQWCAQMAVAQNIGVPWIMCQQADAPQPMINTCNGFYCDNFTPNNPNSPKMWTENWTGWFKLWGGKDPHRPAEDVAFAVARFFQSGGVLNNYYMYHGGTNFGRTAGGPYITTSYDYDAPLDEYGNMNQPKYGHLKQLHAALKVGEKLLTSGTVTTKNFGQDFDMTMYADNATGEKFCFLSNVNGQTDTTFDLQQDGQFFVPAWSVTILQNCNKEIFNSAKINSQISIMVKKVYNKDDNDGDDAAEAEEQPPKLNWMWAPEAMRDTLKGQGKFKASVLLDQKEATFDVSDYLWYMTSGKQMVKGDDYSFVFEKPVSLNLGTNIISLLSATVGLTNYGEWYDLKPTGLVGGSVQLVNGNNTIDLTRSNWSYKVGLNNELNKRLYDPQSSQAKLFAADKLPIGRPLTWYKTTFQAPLGSEPVVVDLQGMGKGHAWVNGNSIGRYWPSQIADANGCDTCDYRGGYSDSRCRSNCGNPSQRWYHVPRSFLNNGTNTLILFEEIGGNMTDISFQIVTVGTICASAYEGSTLELACQGGRTITEIQSATFGDPQAKCGPFKSGSSSVQNKNSLAPVEKACAGKTSCSIDVSAATFGSSSSGSGSTKKLVVQAVCS
ncbi:hypothetical protein COLO4_18061 [Corchorus olitorius]|uniref:Beta-galactosidase n=1 Tax=Corchorus olitorius TaxID=93759 RepID=A0A1R3JAG4_9ROSI|nr:hypothetical protein COLO4_18061 [Corchorus olitorius]